MINQPLNYRTKYATNSNDNWPTVVITITYGHSNLDFSH